MIVSGAARSSPWNPRTWAAAIALPRNGSSPAPSTIAAPARVAGDVDHRREGPVQARGAGLARGDAGGALGVGRVPARRHRERDREDRAVAVDHVHREQQRDAEPAVFDRDPLQLAQRLGAGDVEVRADLAAADPVELLGGRAAS